MRFVIRGGGVAGGVQAPPSKSYTHRALVCGLLAPGKSRISNPLMCDDTDATMRACESFGADIQKGAYLGIEGPDALKSCTKTLDCGGSATTLRLFTAVSALAHGTSTLSGNDSLRKRPVGYLLDALKQLGVNSSSAGGIGIPPITVHGKGIRGGMVSIRGDVSSQFLSALLIACPLASDWTVLELATKLQSMPYIEMTLDVLRSFGADVSSSEGNTRFEIPGRQVYEHAVFTVEGDFSSAANMLAAGAIAGRVSVGNLRPGSKQGDKEIVRILRDMGAAVKENENRVTVEKGVLGAARIDASNIPDLVPICAVLATQASGVTVIENAGRLQLKESDRLKAIASELRKMGADIKVLEDGLSIKGPSRLRGAVIDPHSDHRIAMACAVAGLAAEGETAIEDAECVGKSYPGFFQELVTLGADMS